MNAVLELDAVTRVHGAGATEVTALRAVGFAAYAGELVAVMGPSGSGKSTLLTLAGGLDTPTSGAVRVEGVDLAALGRKGRAAMRRTSVGYVFQDFNLIPALTASKIDIISAAMFITPQRKEVVAFSAPVYSYGEGLIVPKADAKDYTSFADLKGETVGAQVGTAFVEPLKKSGLFGEVKIYDTIPDIIRDVNSGRLKAGFADARVRPLGPLTPDEIAHFNAH